MERDRPVLILEHASQPPEVGRAMLQAYLRDLGSLLGAWPDLVEGARDLRHQGRRLARRLA
jgi:hypothetical protein